MLVKKHDLAGSNKELMHHLAAHNSFYLQERPDGMPHLEGPGASLRQAMVAHFVDGLENIVEIGGHLNPVSGFLHHVPKSFLCIDPKAKQTASDTLNGAACRVRHIARKFQDVQIDVQPGSYGLVLVGYSLKAYGSQDPLGAKLYELIDHSALTVLEYSPNLERASEQMKHILSRRETEQVASVDFTIRDGVFENTGYGQRRVIVLRPVPVQGTVRRA
jgi:hypothetical protein